MKKLIVALIQMYRKYLSPRKRRPSCRFYPTCSAYAITAVTDHGTLRGLALTARRIARCHPWGGQGIDPVPIRHRKHRAAVKSAEHAQGEMLLSLCLNPDQRQETK